MTLVGRAAAWLLSAHALQPATPVIAFISGMSADASARYVAAFRKGLNDTRYIEGKNVVAEYNWLEGHYDRLPATARHEFISLLGGAVETCSQPDVHVNGRSSEATTVNSCKMAQRAVAK